MVYLTNNFDLTKRFKNVKQTLKTPLVVKYVKISKCELLFS